ncbi:MAG: hypothetical protein KBG47_02270 [Bacteroidia bacterium]|nr:hypothetical protein [Bacteroidia bacterium]
MNLNLSKLKHLTSISYTQLLKLSLTIVLTCFSFQIKAQSEEELKKQAEQLFEDEDYIKAYKHYSQLVSNHSTDPLYNYRLGVCMIYAEPDKKKSFSYLNKAYSNRAELPKDVAFFVGKAYHINYLFDEAIRFYNQFKQEAPGSMQKKLQVDREIRACGNGKRLLSTITDLEVLNKKQLNEADYFRSYDLSSVGGKLLVKTDNFKTNVDKKKKDKSILYSTKAGDRVYFSSYGENTLNGRDIYYKERIAGGEFGKPVLVSGINTEFDEDYPFIQPDGMTIYFASKGHNSMGGYDIFRSDYNEATQSWSTPKNLEFPINSPDDDYLFVTDSSEKFAYFSTGRYSPPGKIDVLKIKTTRKPIDFIMMRGMVTKENAKQSVKSKITIKNISTGKDVGTFEANDEGNFVMQLPNGAKLLYTVETPGLRTQSQGVSLPLAQVGKPFKQTVTYENEVLRIINDFEEAPSDDSYLQYLKLIEEKSKLDPNEGKNNLPQEGNKDSDTLLAANNNTTAVETTNPTANGNNTDPKNNTNPAINNKDPKNNTTGINNKELIDIAKKDAEESNKEATQLNQDAWDAKDLGTAKKIEAENKIKAADEALIKAEAITDETAKKEEIAKAIEQKTEGEKDLAVANKVLDLAKTLEKDAANKAKETELNNQYAKELEKIASNPKNNTPEAKQKLDDIQKKIASVSEQKNESENVYNKLKNDISEKEKELSEATEKTNSLNTDNTSALGEIAKTENELAAAKKKKKEEITNRLNQQKSDQQKIETNLAQSKEEEVKLTNELNSMKNELALADKIKTENFAKVETPINSTNTNTTSVASNKTGSQQLEEKYTNKINITDANNKDNISSVNNQLIAYNKDIDAQIAQNKATLAKTKNANEKKAITTDIKNLEGTKKQNQQSIANNNVRINDINKQLLATNNAPNTNQNLKEISLDNPSKAMDQLKDIKASLTQADNALFNFNTYNNTNGQNIKVQADSQINDAYAMQNKLKETIAGAEENIKNSSTNLTKNSDNPESILKQADDLTLQANTLRNDANGKSGDEKAKLLSEADGLDKQAEQKQIEASELSSKISLSKFDVNKENSQTLLATNKADEATVSQAKALMDEADQAIKQAKSIREEANATTNNSAKIGNLGNAEEKELIALNKQNQALDLLKKANPDVALQPYKELGTVNIVNEAVLKEEIAKVNAEVKQLVAAKNTAYKTLSDANEEEIKSASATSASKPNINNTPALKSQQTVITKNLTEIAALKTKVEQSGNETEKLVSLANLVKKQNETILAINKLNSDAETSGIVATNTNTKTPTTNNNTENNTTNNNTENNTVPTNTIVAKNNFSTEQANTAFSVDLSFENHKDTSLEQINSYFEKNNFELRNAQANNSKNSSVDALKALDGENKTLNEAIAKVDAENASSNSTGSMNNVEIKNKINSLLDASDSFAQEASNVKKDAESKTGDEQTSLLNQAKDLEDKSFAKKVEAAQLNMQYNEANYNANKNAINDMLGTVNSSNPDLAASVKAKLDEIETKRRQAKDIREEANALTNNSAKLGAMENADEVEAGLLIKQSEIINELKGAVPDYVVKEPSYNNVGGTKEIPAELKQKQSDLYAKEISALTNLTNAYSMEYETNKNTIPKNLNADQTKVKSNVINLNAESKNLLIRSSKTNDPAERLKLLSLAAKTGLTAATQLNFLINKQPTANLVTVNNKVSNNTTNAVATNTKTNNNTTNAVATNTKTNNNTTNAVATNTKTNNTTVNNTENNTENNTATNNTAGTKVIARIEGLEVLNKNAYSEAKPIPVDAKMPDGLIFRVQIGAFKTKIPNNSFRGLTPVNAETAGNGYTRYTAGNFVKIENASAVKNDLQKNGYPDAFVVVFFNGKRITLAEALAILEREGKTMGTTIASAGIKDNVNPNFATKTETEIPVVVTKELEKTKNLLYTVQIGVYSRLISKERLKSLSPIYSEQLPNGLYRYTAGIYNNVDRLINDKRRVIDLGIKDAFVTAYIDGKRMPYNDAKAKKEADSSIVFEAENPIIFPDINSTNPATNTPVSSITPTFAPFTNNVKEKPAATPENGVKENEDGVTFKVQIGAYSKPVPDDVAARFNGVKTWPIENKVINALYIYNIGSFTEAKFAKQLKEEAVALGITDAFIVVYKDGQKLFGAAASEYLNR